MSCDAIFTLIFNGASGLWGLVLGEHSIGLNLRLSQTLLIHETLIQPAFPSTYPSCK